MRIARYVPYRYGEVASQAPEQEDVQVSVKPSVVGAGLAMWVVAGVLTHVAVRLVDRWFFGEKGGRSS